jgi:hypothetical protein
LKENLPALFRDKDFTTNLDDASKRWLSTLFKSLSNIHSGQQTQPDKKNPFSQTNNGFNNFPISNNSSLTKNNPFLGYESSIYFNGDTKFMNMNNNGK